MNTLSVLALVGSTIYSAVALGAPCVVPSAGFGQEETLKLLPLDGYAGQKFGSAIAMGGTLAVFGVSNDDENGAFSGSCYLFDSSTGQAIAKFQSNDVVAGDRFGASVDVSGTMAIVGAPSDDDNGSQSGSAYLFDTTTRQQVLKLLPNDGLAQDYFGTAVAISGTTAIVGAHFADDNGAQSGSAYLFDTLTGQQIAKLLPNDGAALDHFGFSVGISGTTAIVGAYDDDDNGLSSGSAYLFDVITGQQIAKLVPSDGGTGHKFGLSIDVSGTTAIISAYQDDANGTESGSAYLFDMNSGQQIMKLLPSDGAPGDRFGVRVGISGARAIVGAWEDDDNGAQSGSAYLFDTGTGQELGKLLPSDGAAADYFGSAVATNGTYSFVGAPFDDDNGTQSGAAYQFGPGQFPWRQSPLNGHWYVGLAAFTWAEAQGYAVGLGGHLATVRSQAENDWLVTNYASADSIWIGYTDRSNEGTFTWISGEAQGFENWMIGEPDDGSGADWALLQAGTGLWSDEPDAATHMAVIEVISDDCDNDGNPDVAQIALNPGLDWTGDGILNTCNSPNYCVAASNSSGQAAVIAAGGSPVISSNQFRLQAFNLPLLQPGYFLLSESTAFVQGFGGSSGNLCLGAPAIRLKGNGLTINTGAGGAVLGLTLDLTALPPEAVLLPGGTWHFQLWFRDFQTSNTTDGIEIMFR